MATAATVSVRLDANSVRFMREMAKAEKATNRFSRRGKRDLAELRGAFAGLAAAVSIVSFARIVSGALDAADALAKTSDRLGVTTEKLAGLQIAAKLAGVEQKTLEKGLQNLQKVITDVSRGTGVAIRDFERMGISARDLINLSPDEQLRAVAEAMGNLSTRTEKVTAAYNLFGGRGVAILNMLENGAEGLDMAQEAAERFGLAISRVDAAKVEAANDAMAMAGFAVQGLIRKTTVELAPFIQAAAEEFTNLAAQGEGFGPKVVSALEMAAKGVGVLANGLRGIKILWKGIEIAGRGMAWVVIEALDMVVRTLVALGNTITNAVLFPMRKALEAAAPFSDLARDALASLSGLGQIRPPEGISEMAEILLFQNREAITELQELLMEPLPTQGIEAAFERIRQRAQENAEAIAAHRQAIIDGEGGEDGPAFGGADPAAQRALAEAALAGAYQVDEAKGAIESAAAARAIETARTTEAAITEVIVAEAERRVQAKLDAEAAAREAAGLPAEGVDEVARAQAVAEEITRVSEQLAARQVKIEQDAAKKRADTEAALAEYQMALRQSVVQDAIGLLQVFAGKSKGAALAVLAIQKGLAIAETVVSTQAASMRALAELGPIVGPPVAAAITKLGMVKVGIIAATGLAQAATMGGGGAALGTSVNPITTRPEYAPVPTLDDPSADRGRIIEVNFQGDIYGWDDYVRDKVMGSIRDALDNRDEILIRPGSRQYLDLVPGGG